MNKIALIIAFIALQTCKSFSQNEPRVYFSGIKDSLIKKSQLSDTSIRLVTNLSIPKKSISVNLYFHGTGFSSVMLQTVALGTYLGFMKSKLTVGSRISIDGFVIKDSKNGKDIFFEGRSYKIIDD